ncbi:MAG: type II toxin-antitoxin system HipA family toxin [Deltaproteobacteria bacterium]|nr:type II toxin-antitoxin system HipA family toxin [Deltaproteobacteria bacterium]
MKDFEKVKVKLFDRFVGIMLEDDTGRVLFEYNEKYVNSGPEISPIKLPLEEGTVFVFNELRKKSFMGLPGVFADSLPDAWGSKVIQEYFKQKGIPSAEIPLFSRLLYIGHRGMGALEYEPEIKLDHTEEEIEITELWLKSRKVLEGKIEKHTDDIFKYGGSAGGARAKAVINWDRKSGSFRLPGKKENEGFPPWLIKFDGIVPEMPHLSDPMPWERTEYVYNLMAKEAGIRIPEIGYITEGARFHFMVKRFDRGKFDKRKSKFRKFHMHTLGGLMHMDHNDSRMSSYEIYLNTIQGLTKDNSQVREGFRRMVFNILVQNWDDHVKNFSFLMDEDGIWRISPSYDMVFTPREHPWFSKGHQMTINGKSMDISRADILTVAGNFNVKKPDIIINEVMEAVDGYSDLAGEFEISTLFPQHFEKVKKAIGLRRSALG